MNQIKPGPEFIADSGAKISCQTHAPLETPELAAEEEKFIHPPVPKAPSTKPETPEDSNPDAPVKVERDVERINRPPHDDSPVKSLDSKVEIAKPNNTRNEISDLTPEPSESSALVTPVAPKMPPVPSARPQQSDCTAVSSAHCASSATSRGCAWCVNEA